MRKIKFFPILLTGVFVLAACAQATTPAPPPTSPPAEATEAPAPTETVGAVQPTEMEAPTATEAVEAILPSEEASSKADASYTADVQPIFAQYCFACHSGEGATKGVRLDGYEYALAGGGPVLLSFPATHRGASFSNESQVILSPVCPETGLHF